MNANLKVKQKKVKRWLKKDEPRVDAFKCTYQTALIFRTLRITCSYETLRMANYSNCECDDYYYTM
jgi:hypothetical protein